MSIQKRSYPPSVRYPRGRTVWRVRWLDHGQHRSREFSMQHEARQFEASVTVDQSRAPAPSMLMRELWDAWIAMRRTQILETTEAAYASVWRTHLDPLVGERSVEELVREPKLIADCFAKLSSRDEHGQPRVGRSTQRKAFHMLDSMLRSAVAWNVATANPLPRLGLKPASARRVREIVPLSAVRVESMRAHLLDRARVPRPWRGDAAAGNARDVAIVSLIAYAGLRPAELLALRWRDVDFEHRRVWIHQRNSAGTPRNVKSPASDRDVGLVRVLISDVRAWQLACADTRPTAYVFAAADGGMWPDGAWRSWSRSTYKPAAEAAGRGAAIPYDLRHSYIMRLVLNGWTIPQVAAEAGHEPEVTVRTYLAAYRLHEQIMVARDEDLEEHFARARETVARGIDLSMLE